MECNPMWSASKPRNRGAWKFRRPDACARVCVCVCVCVCVRACVCLSLSSYLLASLPAYLSVCLRAHVSRCKCISHNLISNQFCRYVLHALHADTTTNARCTIIHARTACDYIITFPCLCVFIHQCLCACGSVALSLCLCFVVWVSMCVSLPLVAHKTFQFVHIKVDSYPRLFIALVQTIPATN